MRMMCKIWTGKVSRAIICVGVHSSFCVINFMLPALSSHFFNLPPPHQIQVAASPTLKLVQYSTRLNVVIQPTYARSHAKSVLQDFYIRPSLLALPSDGYPCNSVFETFINLDCRQNHMAIDTKHVLYCFLSWLSSQLTMEFICIPVSKECFVLHHLHLEVT